MKKEAIGHRWWVLLGIHQYSEGASGQVQGRKKKNTEAQQNYCSPPRSVRIVGRLYHHLAHVSGGMEGS